MADILTEEDVAKIVTEGQNFLDGEDYASAVDHFAKALEDIVPRYGEVHDILGKVYLCYGQALLGFARDEADVVVENMVPKEQNGAKGENDVEKIKEDDEDDDDDDEEDEEDSNDGKEEAKESDDKNGEKEDEEKVEEEADDNVDNLQLAWEVLELARKIFLAKGDSGKDHLVETLYYLGDVSIENENFEAAIEDLKECLTLHEELKGKIRRLADVHFKLALAYSMGNQFEESISNLKKASQLLNDRIETLTSTKEKTEEVDKEISEINELLPEIENKITDVLAYREEAHKSVLELLKDNPPKSREEGSTSKVDGKSTSPCKSSPLKANASAVVNDISHLVRRNKRPSDEDDTDATPPKKTVKPTKTT